MKYHFIKRKSFGVVCIYVFYAVERQERVIKIVKKLGFFFKFKIQKDFNNFKGSWMIWSFYVFNYQTKVGKHFIWLNTRLQHFASPLFHKYIRTWNIIVTYWWYSFPLGMDFLQLQVINYDYVHVHAKNAQNISTIIG